MARVVLDASILLAAAVGRPDSPPSLLLDAARAGQIEMIACEQLLAEVAAAWPERTFATNAWATITGDKDLVD